ncbi:hypothetical protein [Facilibium subflavum]|uniref:hypothetical protein n=1 Tax=Facilibium subflavum TaxID=2219058 RepID=UPI000E64A0E1|nr:hypothetical protein [Facilibium subflavum]
MEKFIQEVLVIFAALTALVVLFYVFIFLFWILLIAIGIAVVYRIIKYIVYLFLPKHKKQSVIDADDL